MAMSLRAYAKLRGADEKAIRRAVESGTIRLDGSGRVDPEQADAVWASIRRGSRQGVRQLDDVGKRHAQAKIAKADCSLVARVLAQKYVWLGNRDADNRNRHFFVGRIDLGLNCDPAIKAGLWAPLYPSVAVSERGNSRR
jgi:hypothetical protein